MSEIVLSCDTVIIGAGSAGLEAYKVASASGAHCILVESGPLGTSAKRTGDTPLSYLSAAGRHCHSLMELDKYGVGMSFDFAFDTDHVLNTLRAVRAKDTSEILSFIYRIPESNRLIGRARLLDEHTLMVNESHKVNFKTAVIATGSVPVVPYELSQHQASGGIFTTNDFFDLDHLPNSMAIFGSNREGLQLGQALSYLGVKVIVFGNHNLWNLTDDSVVSAAVDVFNDRFDLVLDSYITAIERYDRGYGIYYLESNYENHLEVETILACSIRYPKLDGLYLRELGMSLGRTGCINVDEQTMQTSIPHIFAAGDVTALNMTTASARAQGIAAGTNAVNYPNLKKFTQPFKLNILATDPELAMVGMTYEEVKQRAKSGQSFVSSEIRLNDGFFRVTQNEGGLFRMYVDEASHKILGSEICMHDASHIAHMLAMAMSQELTVEQVAALPYFNPSYESVIKKACEQATKTIERKVIGL